MDRVQWERQRRSRHGPWALTAMLVPALAFPLGLIAVANSSGYEWLSRWSDAPWELWVVAVFGSIATIAGAADWFIHRSGSTVVGVKEHRAHVAALGFGGVPLFLLMAAASLSGRPQSFLIPIVAVLIFTVVLICYDEFVYHRRCGRFEQLMHRLLTFGNGVAFLAWVHWCFVRGGAHA